MTVTDSSLRNVQRWHTSVLKRVMHFLCQCFTLIHLWLYNQVGHMNLLSIKDLSKCMEFTLFVIIQSKVFQNLFQSQVILDNFNSNYIRKYVEPRNGTAGLYLSLIHIYIIQKYLTSDINILIKEILEICISRI